METSGDNPFPNLDERRIDVNPPKGNALLGFIKNLLLMILLLAIIGASFWVSFLMGKRILVPVKNIPERKFEVAIRESRPTAAALQKIEEVMEAEQAREEVQEVAVVAAEPQKAATPKTVKTSLAKHYYKVQAGVFSSQENAQSFARELNQSGFATYIKKVSAGWRVQVGAFFKRSQAQHLQNTMSAKGFDSIIVYE